MPAPVASGGNDIAGWALHPLESAALSRRTPFAVTAESLPRGSAVVGICHSFPRPDDWRARDAVYGIRQPDGTFGITTDVGKPFRVRVENRIEEPRLIHWHGLTPPW
jgi:hypothetical protein